MRSDFGLLVSPVDDLSVDLFSVADEVVGCQIALYPSHFVHDVDLSDRILDHEVVAHEVFVDERVQVVDVLLDLFVHYALPLPGLLHHFDLLVVEDLLGCVFLDVPHEGDVLLEVELLCFVGFPVLFGRFRYLNGRHMTADQVLVLQEVHFVVGQAEFFI